MIIDPHVEKLQALASEHARMRRFLAAKGLLEEFDGWEDLQ
jgi:hypothetical protein